MKFLETFVATPWAGALGWTLLHSLWEGAVSAAMLGIVMLATKSPRVRYVAGCVAMLAMISAFGVTLLHFSPAAAQPLREIQPLPSSEWRQVVFHRGETWRPSLTAIAPWLAPYWISGVFVFYLRYAAGFISLSRLRRRGVCAAPQVWEEKLGALAAQLRLTRPIVLLESSLAEAPMVIGHLRPLILMPIGLFTGLPAAQIESILLHELAHIRRHDFFVNALQNLLDGILFYHPAAWWISRVIRAEREKCCDDVVVGICGNAHEYARALAALEETRWSGREPALAAKGGSLMKRIHRLLYPPTPSFAWTPVLATSVLFIAAALTLGAGPKDKPAPRVVMQSCPGAMNGYEAINKAAAEKWLNEDVFYIIDDAEREAFQKLTTNEERGCFITQFWDRRNPTPGSSENKFKTEHYRRLAYANAHFAASLPGWQTDRGHMYIVYGPPDEIDSHPEASPHPYQTWGYKHVEGMSGGFSTFMFVDRTGHGDYHLAPSNGH